MLIVEGTSTKFMGKIVKVVSPELSHELWDNLNPAVASGCGSDLLHCESGGDRHPISGAADCL